MSDELCVHCLRLIRLLKLIDSLARAILREVLAQRLSDFTGFQPYARVLRRNKLQKTGFEIGVGDQVRENLDVLLCHKAQEVYEKLKLLDFKIVNVLLTAEIKHFFRCLGHFSNYRIREETHFSHHVEIVGSLANRLVKATLSQHVFDRFGFLRAWLLLESVVGVQNKLHEVLDRAFVLF